MAPKIRIPKHYQGGGYRPAYEKSGDVHDAPSFSSALVLSRLPLLARALLPLCGGFRRHAVRILDVHARFRAKQKLAFAHNLFADREAFGNDGEPSLASNRHRSDFTRLSSLTTKTYWPSWPTWTASAGMTTASVCVANVSATLTN